MHSPYNPLTTSAHVRYQSTQPKNRCIPFIGVGQEHGPKSDVASFEDFFSTTLPILDTFVS
jgi:hypothetical protein